MTKNKNDTNHKKKKKIIDFLLRDRFLNLDDFHVKNFSKKHEKTPSNKHAFILKPAGLLVVFFTPI